MRGCDWLYSVVNRLQSTSKARSALIELVFLALCVALLHYPRKEKSVQVDKYPPSHWVIPANVTLTLHLAYIISYTLHFLKWCVCVCVFVYVCVSMCVYFCKHIYDISTHLTTIIACQTKKAKIITTYSYGGVNLFN